MRAVTWNVSSMVRRSDEVVDVLHRRLTFIVLKRRGGKVEVRGCLVEDTSSYGGDVIRV